MNPSLVILAAGMGSRYGGIKQLDGFGPHGERIIDYTVFDAMRAGYGKIVFVIREAIRKDFEEAILSKWKDKFDIRVVYQELNKLPQGYSVPSGREKPWGTAHAVWMAAPEVQETFAIVNADDFYGRASLKAAAEYLANIPIGNQAACLVGYELSNTLTDFGSVSRGVCEADANGFLTGITERTTIIKEGGRIVFEESGIKTALKPDSLVSMNLMGFTPDVFHVIAAGFDEVYQRSLTNLKTEYYIPTILNQLIKAGVKVPILPTVDQWFGVTYPEDKDWVKTKLADLHHAGAYPADLWS